jgi:Domain of unknown function (DUF305)
MDAQMNHKHYGRLLAMAFLSFVSMVVLMYAMVDGFENVYLNSNQFYMAGLMTAPMVIIELALMRGMYHNKKWNALIIAGSAVVLIVFWTLIRQQIAITDRQFLKSMIPHHAAALLMCEEAPISDPEIQKLCENIISSQQSEIDWMKEKLKE